MIEKQDLVKDLLLKKLSETKVGILAKGFGEIDPANSCPGTFSRPEKPYLHGSCWVWYQ